LHRGRVARVRERLMRCLRRLFEDGSNEAVDRLDALLQTLQGRTSVSELRRG
jgi:hypothetical protein